MGHIYVYTYIHTYIHTYIDRYTHICVFLSKGFPISIIILVVEHTPKALF